MTANTYTGALMYLVMAFNQILSGAMNGLSLRASKLLIHFLAFYVIGLFSLYYITSFDLSGVLLSLTLSGMLASISALCVLSKSNWGVSEDFKSMNAV